MPFMSSGRAHRPHAVRVAALMLLTRRGCARGRLFLGVGGETGREGCGCCQCQAGFGEVFCVMRFHAGLLARGAFWVAVGVWRLLLIFCAPVLRILRSKHFAICFSNGNGSPLFFYF